MKKSRHKTPLALIAEASDLLMVSDSHSHSIYQVCINNNGAFLKGTVSLLLKLPEGAQPMALAFDGNIVYVADSSSNGGITKFNPSTSESQVIVRNGTRFCRTVHGLDVSSDGSVIFTVRTSRVVRRFSQANSDIRAIAGSGADKSRDGSSLAASFSQPTALCVEGKSIFVVDTAVGPIKLILTPTNSLCKILELLHSLCRMFGVHLRGVKAECHTIEEAISSLSELSSLMDLWIDQVQEKMGRKSATQGPQETISAKSRRSVEIVIESLSSMKDFFQEVNPGFQSYLKLAAT